MWSFFLFRIDILIYDIYTIKCKAFPSLARVSSVYFRNELSVSYNCLRQVLVYLRTLCKNHTNIHS